VAVDTQKTNRDAVDIFHAWGVIASGNGTGAITVEAANTESTTIDTQKTGCQAEITAKEAQIEAKQAEIKEKQHEQVKGEPKQDAIDAAQHEIIAKQQEMIPQHGQITEIQTNEKAIMAKKQETDAKQKAKDKLATRADRTSEANACLVELGREKRNSIENKR
jgi:chromosome segregation ATPase